MSIGILAMITGGCSSVHRIYVTHGGLSNMKVECGNQDLCSSAVCFLKWRTQTSSTLCDLDGEAPVFGDLHCQ